MKPIFLLWFLLGGVVLSYAQAVTILDENTEKPLEGVTITSAAPHLNALTNAEGQADIAKFRQEASIHIRYLGYQELAISYADIEAAGFVIRLKPTLLELGEVVVAATRWKQNMGNVPSKVISITPGEVALQNPQTAADLLGISGKVFIQKSQQGGGSPMIRGFATNRLIYTLDGVRMNTAIFRSGNLQNVINLDPFAIEKTEVVFGPGSVIYGSDAIGGTMSFQTLTPQLSLSGEPLVAGKATMRYSSANNEKTGHFDVSVGGKRWAFVTSFSSWDFDHLRQGNSGPEDYLKPVYVQRQDTIDRIITQEDPLLQIPSGYAQINLMQKFRFIADENLELQYGFHYSETSSYGRYDRHNRYRNGTLRYAEWNYGPQKWMMNQFSLIHSHPIAIYDQLALQIAFQFFEESRIDRSLNDNLRQTQTETVDAFSVNLDLLKSLGSKHTLYYGWEYVLNDVSSKGQLTDIRRNTSQNGPSRYPYATWVSLAAYINDAFLVSDKFTLQAGLRYNQFILEADFSNNRDYYPFPFRTAAINNGALTGSLGAVLRPSESWVVKANLGTAFRSPNVDDLGKVFDSEPGSVTIPNPDLKAEQAYNIDLGFAKVFNDKVKLDITGFYTRLQNAMVRRNFQLNGNDQIEYGGELSRVQAIQNAAFVNVYGIQAGLEVQLPKGFFFTTDLNVQVGEEELDDNSISSSRHAAPLFGTSKLEYKLDKLHLEINTIYQAKRSAEDLPQEEQAKDEIYAKDANGNNYSPSWYTLNLKALYEISEYFSISAGLENITDQRYRPYSSGISGPGRNFILSLRINF